VSSARADPSAYCRGNHAASVRLSQRERASCSLRILCLTNREWKSLQPDFIFIDRNGDGGLTASLVDPHSGHPVGSPIRLPQVQAPRRLKHR